MHVGQLGQLVQTLVWEQGYEANKILILELFHTPQYEAAPVLLWEYSEYLFRMTNEWMLMNR